MEGLGLPSLWAGREESLGWEEGRLSPSSPTTLPHQAREGGLDSRQICGEEVPDQASRGSRAKRWPGAPEGAASCAPKAGHHQAPAWELQTQARYSIALAGHLLSACRVLSVVPSPVGRHRVWGPRLPLEPVMGGHSPLALVFRGKSFGDYGERWEGPWGWEEARRAM